MALKVDFLGVAHTSLSRSVKLAMVASALTDKDGASAYTAGLEVKEWLEKVQRRLHMQRDTLLVQQDECCTYRTKFEAYQQSQQRRMKGKKSTH
jgi:hypothetical protein